MTEPEQPVVAVPLRAALEDLRDNGYQPSYNGRASCPFCLNFIDAEQTHEADCVLVAALAVEAVRPEREVREAAKALIDGIAVTPEPYATVEWRLVKALSDAL